MTLEDAIEIIEKENLNRYKKVSFNGEDISENQQWIGTRLDKI